MKTSNVYLLAASMLLCGSAAWADDAPELPKKPSLPEQVYKAESAPAGDWKELKMSKEVNDLAAEVTSEAKGGVLSIKSTNSENQFSQLGWYLLGPGFDKTKGFTIEVKAKVKEGDAYGAFNIQGFNNDGKGFRVGIHKDKIIEFTNPLLATNTVVKDLSNDDKFYTFRMAVTPEGKVHLYRDLAYGGSFELVQFVEDNIIRNGGFEDQMVADDAAEISYDWVDMTPDAGDGDKVFKRGVLNRVKKDDKGTEVGNDNTFDIPEATTGTWMMYANNFDGVGVAGSPNGDLYAHPRYTPIPVKAGVNYTVSVDANFVGDNHGWRQMRLWWNEAFHRHSDWPGVGVGAHANNFVDMDIARTVGTWKSYSKTFSTADNRGSVADIKSVIFDLPNGNFKHNPAIFDNVCLKEEINYDGKDSFFFFGKSMGMESVDVEIEYIAFDLTGAFAPGEAAVDDATLQSIKLGDKALPGFASATESYDYYFASGYDGNAPVVSVVTNSPKATPVITQATAVPGTATIVVTAEDGKATKTYTINFKKSATGIDDLDSMVSVYAEGMNAIVNNAPQGAVIAVYDLNGRLITQTTETTIALPAQGIYIVNVDGDVFRVIAQ